MRLNFDDVKETKAPEAGRCELTIKNAEEKKSQNGTNMLVLDMEDATGGFVRDHVCLEGAGAFRAKNFMKAIGVTEEDFMAMDATELVGLTVEVELINEEYEGELRAKVKKYYAA